MPDALQSSLFWPLIAGSVIATEAVLAVGMAASKLLLPAGGALTAAAVAMPLVVKAASAK